MKSRFLQAFLLCLAMNYGQTQASNDIYRFDIGEVCPDIPLGKIENETGGDISISDFNNKWLVLDFWNKNCAACIGSFPAVNAMQQSLKDSVQFILIGEEDKQNQIRSVYNRFRAKLGLQLKTIYDSALFRKFDIGPCPFVVVLDPSREVRAITVKLTESAMRELMHGGSPELIPALNIFQMEQVDRSIDMDKPLLIAGNGGSETNYIFRSLLMPYDNSTRRILFDPVDSRVLQPGFFQVTGASILMLYKTAYGDTISSFADQPVNSYGKFSFFPLAETRDSVILTDSKLKKYYNYSLAFPPEKADFNFMRDAMRRDLKTYFGYDVIVEKRMMPCWKLQASEKARKNLSAVKNGKKKKNYKTGTLYENMTMKILVSSIAISQPFDAHPIIDATSITSTFNLHLDSLFTDFEEISRELETMGLFLVPDTKEMSVVVIRDRESF